MSHAKDSSLPLCAHHAPMWSCPHLPVVVHSERSSTCKGFLTASSIEHHMSNMPDGVRGKRGGWREGEGWGDLSHGDGIHFLTFVLTFAVFYFADAEFCE